MDGYIIVDSGQEEILERIPVVVKQEGCVVAEFESVVNHKTIAREAKKGVLNNPQVPAVVRDNPESYQMVFVDEENSVKDFIDDEEHMSKYAIRLAYTASLEIVSRGSPL